MGIRNIIFDIGKVLVSYEPDLYMKEQLGFDEKTREAVNQALFENEVWDMSDRGVFPPEQLLAMAIANNPSYEEQIRLAWENVTGAIELFPYVIDWISEYKKQGYGVYILSNYAEHTLEKTRDTLAFLPMMDGVVFSYACKLMKPEREIYGLLLSEYDIKAEESIFIDDRLENVQGANEVGIHGIHFKDFESAKAQVDYLCKTLK